MHLSREILLFIATTHYNKQSSLVKEREPLAVESFKGSQSPQIRKIFVGVGLPDDPYGCLTVTDL